MHSLAYADRPLPIGHGQTISQPFIVAFMTEALKPAPADKVLEIGTGSGYQAAVLAELVAQVYTIEIVKPLGERAREDLARLGYANVHVRVGDGYEGWPENAPFDAIIVTCSPEQVPQPLVDQLREGGRMVIPVGTQAGGQDLYLLEKRGGKVVKQAILPVRFVPMTGKAQGR
jgi:protein-L-isoaspartate(D-aspartate) O-methyltransferase